MLKLPVKTEPDKKGREITATRSLTLCESGSSPEGEGEPMFIFSDLSSELEDRKLGKRESS